MRRVSEEDSGPSRHSFPRASNAATVIESWYLAHRPRRATTILFIDDDADQRALFELLLSEAGFRVITAPGVRQGLESLVWQYVDIVISDIRMPEVNGLDLASHLQNLRFFPNQSKIPLILLTAGGAHYESRAREAGADLFCPKEHASRLLISQIRSLL